MRGRCWGSRSSSGRVGDKDHPQLVDGGGEPGGRGGIEPVELTQISGVKIQDPELQKELAAALAALAQARDKDKKPVEIHFAGQGDRRVRIGYVVETPVWKTSYRLILPGAVKNPASTRNRGERSRTTSRRRSRPRRRLSRDALQGWAIVENQTDSDWKDVQLWLVSGRPISFIEDLYQPLYIPRPVVQPELYASLQAADVRRGD